MKKKKTKERFFKELRNELTKYFPTHDVREIMDDYKMFFNEKESYFIVILFNIITVPSCPIRTLSAVCKRNHLIEFAFRLPAFYRARRDTGAFSEIVRHIRHHLSERRIH